MRMQRNSEVSAMLAAAVPMGYLYQGPPFRLSYQGLGEPLCFAAFGPLATTAFYLTQACPTAPHPQGPPVNASAGHIKCSLGSCCT